MLKQEPNTDATKPRSPHTFAAVELPQDTPPQNAEPQSDALVYSTLYFGEDALSAKVLQLSSTGALIEILGTTLAPDWILSPGQVELDLIRAADGDRTSCKGCVVCMTEDSGRQHLWIEFVEPGETAMMKLIKSLMIEPKMIDPGGSLAPGMEERRRTPRGVLRTAITMHSTSNFFSAYTRDLSEGGLFVATPKLQPLGSQHEVEFSLPDGRAPIRAVGVVRWVRDDHEYNEGEPGMGLEFITLSDADRQRVEAFVARRDTIFYD
jgi:uncharacterized protein (TIGR02266 family)